MDLEGFLSALYFMTTGLVVFSYVPQIIRLMRDRGDSTSISLLSWSIWVYSSTVAVLYTSIVNGDPLLILSTSLNAAGCYAVLCLAVFNRHFKARYFDGEGKSLVEILRRAAPDMPPVPEVMPAPVPVRVRGNRRKA